ncbi:MAG: NHL repeat-containing protein, partial [Planctomycetota bacterium]
IEMPSDLAFDNAGKLYVVDSKKNTIWVFNPNGAVIRSIGKAGTGDGQFDFPIALEIAYRVDSNGLPITELFVADRGHYLIHVFDLDGNFKRSFGEPVNQSMMGGWRWQGKFVKLQGLAMDSDDNLHVLDCYTNKVQMLDPNTGAYRDSYGDLGTEEDKLSLPFDIMIDVNEIPDGNDISIITDTGKERIEAYTIDP